MIVVCNSTPLIALSRIGKLELLREYFSEVYIPCEVYDEVVKDYLAQKRLNLRIG
jgi:predicted nucleic acid-binding protein